MGSSPAEHIVLSEVDVEMTLLGSLFLNDGAFEQFAHALKPEWFGDELMRFMFEAGMRIIDAGNRITPPTLMASLPVNIGTTTRGELYAQMCSAGLPVSMIGGLMHTLKDRWARRSLIAMAGHAASMAIRHDADPYEVTSDCLTALDIINEVQGERAGGSYREASDAFFAALRDPDRAHGATTGVRILDAKLNGYKAGQLYVIAGRPGMGKSAYMCSSARRTAATGVGVAIFSLEMTREEIVARMTADALDATGAPGFGALLKGDFDGSRWDNAIGEADAEIRKSPLHIDASERLSFAQIAGRARRLKAEMEAHGVKLGAIWIDHLGLVAPSNRYAGQKVLETAEVSGGARALAKELDTCVILLSQLSREVEKREDKRPVMADLRWSGEIEQDAHVVGFLYREEYYLDRDDPDIEKLRDARWKLDFLIRKNRNGATDDVRLWCSIAHSSIRDNE